MWFPIHSRASLRFRLLYTHPRQPALSLQHLNAPYQQLRPSRSHLPLSQKLLRCRYHAGYGSRLLPAFPSLKCSLIRSSRPGGQTALRHHRDLAMMGQSWVHPRVPPHLLHLTWVMSLLQLLSYPPYVNTQFTVPDAHVIVLCDLTIACLSNAQTPTASASKSRHRRLFRFDLIVLLQPSGFTLSLLPARQV